MRQHGLIGFLWAIAGSAWWLLLLVFLLSFAFSGSSTAEESCTSFGDRDGVFHSSKPFQDRQDAIVVAYKMRRAGSKLHYVGCVFTDGVVDHVKSSVMFDELAYERQAQCLNAYVSLAPSRLWGYKRAAQYGSRPPTEEEVERRRGRCTFEAAKQDVIDDLKWRRFG